MNLDIEDNSCHPWKPIRYSWKLISDQKYSDIFRENGEIYGDSQMRSVILSNFLLKVLPLN